MLYILLFIYNGQFKLKILSSPFFAYTFSIYKEAKIILYWNYETLIFYFFYYFNNNSYFKIILSIF